MAALALDAAAALSAAQQPTAAVSPYALPFERTPSVAAMTAIGRRLFFDRALSASGKLSCATCHDPAFAFGPSTSATFVRGGPDLKRQGFRAIPSLRYTQSIPPFTEHFHESEGDDSADQGPAGGRTWDGRAQSAHEQARLPLLSPFEMANASADEVTAKLRRAPYADELRAAFGDHVLDSTTMAFGAAVLALEVFQQSPGDFYPYDSKYDGYLRRQVELTPREARGLALFNDPVKGNCAVCHPSAIRNGAFPQFTDYGFVALGVPRNPEIPANRDPRFFDLGLCGPQRTDLAGRTEYCGMFRTPSLRNVALRHRFFHNGAFRRLEDVVAFYVGRDLHPRKWYPRAAGGGVRIYDDLPPQYHSNVYRDAPFDGTSGGNPALSAADIRDLIAFLETLTDGYRPDASKPKRQARPPTAAR